MPSVSPEPVGGIVDAEGRLTAADPPLEQLQREAGSALGRPLAVPQLALIVRLARKLGVTISRPAMAASKEADLDLWVRAEPQNGEVRLLIESWSERPALSRRWPDDERRGESVRRAEHRFELGPDLRLVSLSAELARQLDTTVQQAAGLPLTRLVQLEPDDGGDMPLLRALAQRVDFSGQRVVPRAGGGALVLSGEVRLGSGGEFAGFSGAATEPPVASFALTATPELDELLRLPIDRIVSEAQQIADRAQGPLRSDYATYASDIMAASRHLLDVLKSMSATAAAGSGGDESDRPDLVALALEAAGLVQAQAAEADVTLEVDGETALPARADARAVTQILVNIIGNAVRHSPRGGTVRIAAARGLNAEVSIADEGPGVAPSDRERIFEPFEQAGSGGAPGGGAAGLGLAIARRLARSMGGDILLDSTPGTGARFTLRLPLA